MRFSLLTLVFATCSIASAQTPTPAGPATHNQVAAIKGEHPRPVAPDGVQKATEAQLREYFILTHLGDTMKALVGQMISAMKSTSAPYIPDTVWEDMNKTLGEFDFLTELIPIYQKHLSRDDMDGVLAFYHSQAGKDLLANQTAMSNEAQTAFRTIGGRLGKEVGERHSAEIVAAQKKYEERIANQQNLNMNPDPK